MHTDVAGPVTNLHTLRRDGFPFPLFPTLCIEIPRTARISDAIGDYFQWDLLAGLFLFAEVVLHWTRLCTAVGEVAWGIIGTEIKISSLWAHDVWVLERPFVLPRQLQDQIACGSLGPGQDKEREYENLRPTISLRGKNLY